MEFELLRLVDSPLSPTTGVLSVDGRPLFLTLEPPNKNNQPSISCIPQGFYTCQKIDSPRFGRCLEVTNVPNRSEIILGHKGNYAKDTHGCILLGFSLPVDGTEGIRNSTLAIDYFKKLISFSDKYQLLIKNA